MRVLFKNGTVVSGRGTRRADVLVDGERVTPCRYSGGG